VGESVGSPVGDSVGAEVGKRVGDDVGSSAGDVVGELVGDTVGSSRSLVGDSLGAGVGFLIGSPLGASLRNSLGLVLGDLVGVTLDISVGARDGLVVGRSDGDSVEATSDGDCVGGGAKKLSTVGVEGPSLGDTDGDELSDGAAVGRNSM